MVVQFCEDCGNLLDDLPDEVLQCELCGNTAKSNSLPTWLFPPPNRFGLNRYSTEPYADVDVYQFSVKA